MLIVFGFLYVKRYLQRYPDLTCSFLTLLHSQKHASQLYSQRKNNVVDGFVMTGSNQLLFKLSVVNSIDLALICPYEDLVTLTSTCQGSDSTMNLNLPVKRKQTLGLMLTSRYLFPWLYKVLTFPTSPESSILGCDINPQEGGQD